MSHLPDAIHVRVSASNEALPSLLVLTRIVMHELNDYWGVFGPTSTEGSVTISRDDLLQSARVTREYYPEEFADALLVAREHQLLLREHDVLDPLLADGVRQLVLHPAHRRAGLR